MANKVEINDADGLILRNDAGQRIVIKAPQSMATDGAIITMPDVSTSLGGGSDSDEKAKVSSNDTTAGYLNGKLVAGTNVTLTENNNGGNETLTISAAGGVTGFTGSQNATTPNNTVNASRLIAEATSANADIVISPKGTGAILGHLPDNTVTGGNKRGVGAVDLQTTRYAVANVASGNYSTIAGGQDNKATNTNAVISGGTTNVVTGSEGTVTGGYNNNVSGSGGTAIGRGHTVSGSDSVCAGSFNYSTATGSASIGGNSNQAYGNYSATLGGQNIYAHAHYSSVIGGNNQKVETNANYSSIGGGQGNWIYNGATYARVGGGNGNQIFAGGTYGTIAGGVNNAVNAEGGTIIGGQSAVTTQMYQIAYASGALSLAGDCQYEAYFLRKVTTDGSQQILTANGGSIGGSNKITIVSDATYTFSALVTARNRDASESAGYKIEGIIHNNAGTTTFLGTPTITVLGETVAGWDATIIADDTNDSLNIAVTGEVGKTIAWAAFVQLVKIKY